MVALAARFARLYDEGAPLPDHPGRLFEENLWRAIRYGMSGDLIDLEQRRAVPARARIEALLDDVSDVARELGIAPHLAPLEGENSAERAAAELEAGRRPEDLWPAMVARTRESVCEWLTVREGR